MTDVPKIVHSRLRALTPEQQAAEQTHPEADVLSAFAEQALSAAERDGVLQHLALCADCRDVVALALPAGDLAVPPMEAESEDVKTPSIKPRTNWFAWANLHWTQLSGAALAAGVAVAILVVRPELEHLAKPSPPANSIASQLAAPPRPAASAAVASPPQARTFETKPAATEPKAGLPANKPRIPKPSPQAETGMALASTMKKESSTEGKPIPAPLSGALAFEASRGTNETVVLESESSAATTATTADSNLIAQSNTPEIRKAKPPIEGTEVSEQKTMGSPRAQAMVPLNGGSAMQLTIVPQNASWQIVAGVLQRSLDGGQSWQTAVRGGHALLCYAPRGQEIWAGGQAGTLLHSTDRGATWNTIQVSFQGQRLTSDVTHIDLRNTDVQGPAEIVLATSTETWSSADGGKSWAKK